MTDLAQAAAWHRRVSAIVEAADRAGVAGAELPGVRARLQAQQLQLAQLAARDGLMLPALTPTPGEVATQASVLGDFSTAAIAQAIRDISTTLYKIDTLLGSPAATPTELPRTPVTTTTHPSPPGAPVRIGSAPSPPAAPPGSGSAEMRLSRPTVERWAPAARNSLAYGGYAFAVLAAQLIMLMTLDEEHVLPLLAPVCLLVLPAFAWAAGWLTIGIAFRPPPGAQRVNRTPRLGAVICLLPNLALCAGVGLLFVTR